MNESLVFIALAIIGCILLTWYIMNKKVKNISNQLSDKQVVINELANYAEKITSENDNMVVKKSPKKRASKTDKNVVQSGVKPKKEKVVKSKNTTKTKK